MSERKRFQWAPKGTCCRLELSPKWIWLHFCERKGKQHCTTAAGKRSEKTYHKITEHPELEWTCKDHQFQHASSHLTTKIKTICLKTLSNSVGAMTTALGKMFQKLNILLLKNLFTESQNVRDWKGPQKIIKSNPPARALSLKSIGTWPVDYAIRQSSCCPSSSSVHSSIALWACSKAGCMVGQAVVRLVKPWFPVTPKEQYIHPQNFPPKTGV